MRHPGASWRKGSTARCVVHDVETPSTQTLVGRLTGSADRRVRVTDSRSTNGRVAGHLHDVHDGLSAEPEAVEVRLATDDLMKVLASADVAAIVVDGESRLLCCTPAAGDLLQLTAADVGRSLCDLPADLLDDQLVAAVRHASDGVTPIEPELLPDENRSLRFSAS